MFVVILFGFGVLGLLLFEEIAWCVLFELCVGFFVEVDFGIYMVFMDWDELIFYDTLIVVVGALLWLVVEGVIIFIGLVEVVVVVEVVEVVDWIAFV